MNINSIFTPSAAFLILLLLTPLNGVGAELQHNDAAIEEVIVTSTLHRSRADTALPVNILAGEELREKVGATLGETLQNEVGVNIASFGPSVGAPVIRGQGGNRVQILQGGVGNIDASAISADHASSLEPALADRIEVLRGPSTLLYGNGAIGGVVNVIDNRIPTRLTTGTSGLLETRNNNASDQQVSVMKLEGSAGQFAWHIDGVYRDSNDVEIPGFAINPDIVDLNDEEQVEALIKSKGKIANSDARATVKTFGSSWIVQGGHIGFSLNQLENQYGIPNGIGHHDESLEDEPLDSALDEDPHGEGGIRIAMEQERADVELLLPLTGWFDEVHGRLSSVDYQHAEIEGNGEVGTVFEQDGLEGRFVFHLRNQANRDGVIGLQFSHRNFSAVGEEAFIPATDIDSSALFSVYSIDTERAIYEFGLRAEQRTLEQINGTCDNDEISISGSGSVIWRVSERTNLLFSVAHSQRSATVEELYSNIDTNCSRLGLEELVEHAATQRFEIGNPNVDLEKSTNVEFGWRQHMGNVTGEVNFFYNDIADYIFLFDTGVYQGDVQISAYQQDDAVFHGFEAELNLPLYRTGDHLSELALFSDYVSAEFESRGKVPRIPPWRYGIEWRHSHLNWQTKLRWAKVDEQNDLAVNETASASYDLLNLYVDYHLESSNFTSLLFLRGINLLDETIRHHSSLLKDYAPAPGRALEVGVRFEF